MELNNLSGLDNIDLKLLEALQTDASQSNVALAEKVHVSPPTCLRRIKRLHDLGLIERQVAILNADRMKAFQALEGSGLTAIVEVSLTAQTEELLAAFEKRIHPESAIHQCYRVSPGPDLILVIDCADMSAYQQLAQKLFTQDASVRNVRAFFSIKRSKFDTRLPLRSA